MNKSIIKIWVFVLFFLPLTLKLGFWQLERSAGKTELIEKMKAGFAQPASHLVNVKDAETFRPYVLSGTFSQDYYLLDNRINEGKVGYEVLSPFFYHSASVEQKNHKSGAKNTAFLADEYSESGIVLVNRGWIPAKKYRDQLPQVITPTGQVELHGYFHETSGKVPVLKDLDTYDHFPLRVERISWEAMGQQLKQKFLIEKEFRLLAQEKGNVETKTNTPANIGVKFKVGWPITTMLPSRHTAYAVQWFALAFALLVLAIMATIKIKKESADL